MKRQSTSMRRRVVVTAVTSVLVLLGAGCTTTANHAAAPTRYYVSLGDSYSVGYQPSPKPGTTAGYTAYVASKARLKLENFGCGGATTSTILNADGCTTAHGLVAATDAVAYTSVPQAAAAVAFIRAHHGSIGLVTVSIGGNDVTACASASNPIACVAGAVGAIKANVTTLASQLRSAAGPRVPIIGITYPDVILGLWVYPPGKTNQSLATLSVTAFQSLVNPALETAYTAVGGKFVDVTAATGAYTPLTDLTTLAPYGSIPVAVAEVCKYTWYCTLGNIHAKTAGYDFIGQQIAAQYARMPHP